MMVLSANHQFNILFILFFLKFSILPMNSFRGVDALRETNVGNFLCKSCGETIASGKQLHHYASLNSLKLWNQTLLGIKNIPIQVFQNPNGNKFNVLTFSKCNAHSLEEVYNEATWFQGFAWKMSVCPRCGKHLGWKYQPINFNHVTHSEEDTFYGLILDNLLEESTAELLIPNSYKS